MKITEIVLRKVEPSEGMKLTNGSDLAENEVYLGVNDSSNEWYEITKEEYNAILAEREEKLKEISAKHEVM